MPVRIKYVTKYNALLVRLQTEAENKWELFNFVGELLTNTVTGALRGTECPNDLTICKDSSCIYYINKSTMTKKSFASQETDIKVTLNDNVGYLIRIAKYNDVIFITDQKTIKSIDEEGNVSRVLEADQCSDFACSKTHIIVTMHKQKTITLFNSQVSSVDKNFNHRSVHQNVKK